MNDYKTMNGVYTGLALGMLIIGSIVLIRGVVETNHEKRVRGNDEKECVTAVHKCDINSFERCSEFLTPTPSVAPLSETSTPNPLSYHKFGPEN